MTVTLNGTSIENLVSISESQRPRLATTPLGIHSLVLAQSMKASIIQYQVNCVWAGGDSDYSAKKAVLQDIVDSGLPVWFDAQDWSAGTMLFGKVSDVQIIQSEGRVDIWDVSFLITGVMGWGYTIITDDGNGNFVIYGTSKTVQSRTINPQMVNCSFSKTNASSGTFAFSIYVKNIHATTTGIVKLEIMVPDGVTTGSVTTNVVTTKATGLVGASGISSTPGTRNRLTLTRSLSAGTEELWTMTITFGSLKTSYLDGSVDDIVG